MVDTQRLVVEEAPESLSGGEQPKRINVFVKEDLVEPQMEEKTTPGSRIKVIGVLKEVPVPLRTGGMSTRFELAVEANNIIPLEETFEEFNITDEDEKQILELAQDPEIFDNLAKSITPSVWGYQEIKRSLVLQLFGGVQKTHTDGQKSRGDIHILLIGDPGVAKSVTLSFIANISPKGRYVVGKSASGAGLTATVVRDEYLRGWSLEAGAMVLANKGLVCIDELEKMDPQDRSAMHEAMEQQTVTISKANVQASLRAETSVLAAANPKFGRFDPYQSIAQQIDLPPTLINRFDIIFTLRDIPDREKDERIATHVLSEHRKEGKSMYIPRELFRKYVAYAKQRIKPQLSNPAIEEIKHFYIELRNKPVASEAAMRPIPISARQLQALIRMSEASAKLRLSSTVTKEDAIKAIDIMKYYLMQVGYDYESKTIDIDRISGKFSSSQRNKILVVRDAIAKLEEKLGKQIPVEELEKELDGKVSKGEIEEAIEKLGREGTIFKPRRGFVALA
jgi:replicative DNA helicase Mcm